MSRTFEVIARSLNEKQTRKASITIADIKKISDGDFRVDFKTNTITASAQDIAQAFRDLTKGQTKMVPNSLFCISPNGDGFRAAVATVTDSVPYNEEALKGKRVVTANVFIDDEDESIWGVVGEGEAKRLVKRSVEDQASILHQAYNANARRALASTDEEPQMGDYAAFYDVGTASVKQGFLANVTEAGFTFIERESRSPFTVNANAILASTDAHIYNKALEIRANNGGDPGAEFIAYLHELYDVSNEYIEALENVLNSYRRY